MTDSSPVLPSEWNYEIEADQITSKPLYLNIEPDDEAKNGLCRRLDLNQIIALKAEFQIQRDEGNMVVHIQGKITGKLEQKCVVMLDPVLQNINEDFEAWYADETQAVSFARAKRDRLGAKEKEDQPILEEHEDPEPIIDGKIDIGELTTQYLSLALNPYPRSDDAKLKDSSDKDNLEEEPEGIYNNPFAALKNWKKKDN